MDDPEEIKRIEAAIKDLELDYMRGMLSEDEYNKKTGELRSKLREAGGVPSGLSEARESLKPPPTEKAVMTDPVTAVKKVVQAKRRISIEQIAQDSGVNAMNVTRILTDLLDGRELSGRIDHDGGDFILGTGTGPPPKTIKVCPYCRSEMERIAVRGETVTCSVCRESIIVS
ncbi:MAG: PCI domain-containing protein [Candidatus Hermodarchaeota archaeon]